MIRDRGVAHRYTGALFGAAVKNGQERAVLADLQSLEDLHLRDASWQRFLEAPDVPAEQKVALIRSLLQGKVEELVVRFLLLMLQKKRIQHLPLVFEPYRLLVEEHLGVVRARVETAIPLPRELADALRERLERLTGKKIVLEPRVEPAIIGGIIVSLAGKIIDASLRHQLSLLREQLKSAAVTGSGGS